MRHLLKSLIFTAFLLPLHLFAQERTERSCSLYLPEQDVCATLKWIDGPHLNQAHSRTGHRMPSIKQYSTLDVTFWKKDDSLKKPLQFSFVKIYPWMIMHGMEHGTRPVTLSLLPNGHYRASKILFMKMGHGHWEMRLTVRQQLWNNFDPRLDYDAKTRVAF